MASKTTKLVAEICLYGNLDTGAGWLALVLAGPNKGKLLGDGTPQQGMSNTMAVWLACREIEAQGLSSGRVCVYSADGLRQADTSLQHPAYYGSLEWQAAPVYEISAEAIEAACKQL